MNNTTQRGVYSNYIEPNIENCIRIEFTKQELLPIIELTKQIVEDKQKGNERNHRVDNISAHKRFMTGLIGELALERIFNINIIDYNQADNQTHSKFFNRPDLEKAGFNIGVKTVEYGKVPLIPSYNNYSQIICIRDTPKSVIVCGIATPEILNEYQSEALIIANSIKRINNIKKKEGNTRTIKTGFYGFHKLKDIKSLKEYSL